MLAIYIMQCYMLSRPVVFNSTITDLKWKNSSVCEGNLPQFKGLEKLESAWIWIWKSCKNPEFLQLLL